MGRTRPAEGRGISLRGRGRRRGQALRRAADLRLPDTLRRPGAAGRREPAAPQGDALLLCAAGLFPGGTRVAARLSHKARGDLRRAGGGVGALRPALGGYGRERVPPCRGDGLRRGGRSQGRRTPPAGPALSGGGGRRASGLPVAAPDRRGRPLGAALLRLRHVLLPPLQREPPSTPLGQGGGGVVLLLNGRQGWSPSLAGRFIGPIVGRIGRFSLHL